MKKFLIILCSYYCYYFQVINCYSSNYFNLFNSYYSKEHQNINKQGLKQGEINEQGDHEYLLKSIIKVQEYTPLESYDKLKQYPRGNILVNLNPIIQCPKEILNVYGEGDEEKRICGQLDSEDCVVISLGSNNQWGFELDLIKKQPKCKVYNYECNKNVKVTDDSSNSLIIQKGCIDKEEKTINNQQYITWDTVLSKLQKKDTLINALIIDIDGYEWGVLRTILQSSITLPETITIILHTQTSHQDLKWSQRGREITEIPLLIDYLLRYGYFLVNRHDSNTKTGVSEIIVSKLAPSIIHKVSKTIINDNKNEEANEDK